MLACDLLGNLMEPINKIIFTFAFSVETGHNSLHEKIPFV